MMENLMKPRIRFGWVRALLFLVAVIVITLIGQIIGVVIGAAIGGIKISDILADPRIIEDLGVWNTNLITLIGFLFMLLTVCLFRRFIDRDTVYSLGFQVKPYVRDMLYGLVWGLVLIGAGFIFLTVTGHLQVRFVSANALLLAGYFVLFLIGSANEEIMVRGYLFTNLNASMNRYIALLVSSLLFAMMHLANSNISVLGFINIFLAGVLLGIYYLHRRNLWFPITLHLSWNFFQGPVFGFEVSGNVTHSIVTQEMTGPAYLTGEPFGFEGSLTATVIMIIGIVALHMIYRNQPLKEAP